MPHNHFAGGRPELAWQTEFGENDGERWTRHVVEMLQMLEEAVIWSSAIDLFDLEMAMGEEGLSSGKLPLSLRDPDDRLNVCVGAMMFKGGNGIGDEVRRPSQETKSDGTEDGP
jgi:hypothetical protein